MDKFKEFSKTALVLIGAAAVVLVVILAVSLMAVLGVGWFQRGTADFRGKVAATNQVRADGSYRIAAYDHFYDLCAGVQTDEARIKNTLDELKVTTDPTRKGVLLANLDAQRNKRSEDINQYNADAHKADTVGHFKASDLPYQLDPNKEETKCTI
jgi:hypothetical protein